MYRYVLGFTSTKSATPFFFLVIECEGLADPDNGIVTITPSPNKIGVGSEANYRCNRGFNLEGESMLTCNESGLWTNTTPMCRREHQCSFIKWLHIIRLGTLYMQVVCNI